MGIQGLHAFIKKNAPKAKFSIRRDSFVGRRVAIDANGRAHAHLFVSKSRVMAKTELLEEDPDEAEILDYCIRGLIRYGCEIIDLGGVPVFVFDGPDKANKIATSKRKKERQKVKDSIEELTNELKDLHVLARPTDKMNELRKLKGRDTYVTADMSNYLMSVLSAVGFPCLQAKGEAEKLCSSLLIEGKVAGIISEDGDCLVNGAGFIIKEAKGGLWECIELEEILNALNITFPSFVDMCIMAGCDYNQNLFRYGIGTAYKDLAPDKRIEDILPKIQDKQRWTEEEIEGLRYEICRKEFAFQTCEECLNPNTDNCSLETLDLKPAQRGPEEIGIFQALEEANLADMTSKVIETFEQATKPLFGTAIETTCYIISGPSAMKVVPDEGLYVA